MGKLPAANLGQASCEPLQALGFRLLALPRNSSKCTPSAEEVAFSGSKAGADYYETSDPSILGKAVNGVFSVKTGAGRQATSVWYLASRRRP